MMLEVDLNEGYSIDPSYSNGMYLYYNNNLLGYEIVKYWP